MLSDDAGITTIVLLLPIVVIGSRLFFEKGVDIQSLFHCV